MSRPASLFIRFCLCFFMLYGGGGTAAAAPAEEAAAALIRTLQSQQTAVSPKAAKAAALIKRAQADSVPVILELKTPSQPVGRSADPAGIGQDLIQAIQDQVLDALSAHPVKRVKRMKHLPLLSMHLDAAGLEAAVADPRVAAIHEDRVGRPYLAQSVALIQGDDAWNQGASGSGQTVAVLDTGVQADHPFLAGKVVHEACFSSNVAQYGATAVCPNGQESQTGPGAGAACDFTGCDHGTHVAGIVAGRSAGFSGVARDAQIMAVQVFSRFPQSFCAQYGYNDACALTFTSDQISALEHVYDQRGNFSIAAVNMSLGGGRFSQACDSEPQKMAIDLLRSAGIATVIASGNESYADALGSPACISSAISVGSTTKSDGVSSFSNSAQILDLLAPGSSINSSVVGGGFASFNGTSMAAPHVAGAIAALRSAVPQASVDELLQSLRSTGTSIRDPRNDISKPRIDVAQALSGLGGITGGGVLGVSPDTELLASGDVGGPFSPDEITYTLTNDGDASLGFQVTENVVWAGVSPSGGTLAPGASTQVRVSLDAAAAAALAADTYATAVNFTNTTNGRGDTSRAVSLVVGAPSLSNDKFQDAIVLDDSSGSTTGTNENATRETGEPNHAGVTGGRSVWWRWTATAAGEAVFDTAGSGFDTVLAVYTGTEVNGLTAVAGNDDAIGLQSRVSFEAQPGVTYYIAVDGYGGAGGEVVLNWAFTPNSTQGPVISVSPQALWSVQGPRGGPFTPNRQVYTLSNVSAEAQGFTILDVPDWITPFRTEGTLAAGASQDISFLLNERAADLAAGSYEAAMRFNETVRTVRLTVEAVDGVGNDDFDAAFLLQGSEVSTTASSVGATLEAGELDHGNVPGGHSIWWRWVAPASGAVTVHTQGSDFDTTLGVYTGVAVDGLTSVAGNDDDPNGGRHSRVSFTATAGVTYRIAVDGWQGDSGNVTLALSLDGGASGPTNDAFDDAAVVSGNEAQVTGDNRNATAEPGEPRHGGVNGGRSVWWRWTAQNSGPAAIDTFGSSYDTTLGVYTGNRVDGLTAVAGNDDATDRRQSAVSFLAVGGTTYFIAVDGYEGAGGDITLNIDGPSADGRPDNDDFADANPLRGEAFEITAFNQGATAQSGEPARDGALAAASVWWRWTAPGSGPVAVATPGSDFDTTLGVYTGDRVDALTTIAENDDDAQLGGNGLQSLVTFQAQAGITYHMAVDGYEGATGRIVLLMLSELTAPADRDDDAVPDNQDNCPDTANPTQTDTDGDGQGDACDTDDDNDRMPDTYERSHGFDPLDAADAGEDADGDGDSNLTEFEAGTDPNDPLSRTLPPGAQPGELALSAASLTVNENAGTVSLQVARAGGSDGLVSVDYATEDGSARAGSDYTAVSGTLRLVDGQTQATIELPILDDGAQETGETLRLILDNPRGGAGLGTPAALTLTIADNDQGGTASPGVLEFATDTLTVDENRTAARVMVSRGNGSDGLVTVDYAMTDGSARSGEDYVALQGTLQLETGSTFATLEVPLLDDQTEEPDETFQVALSNPGNGATLGARSMIQVTLRDDDAPDNVQEVFPDPAVVIAEPGESFQVPVRYDVSDGNASLVGFGLRFYYDSSQLTWNGFSDTFADGLQPPQDQPLFDGNNEDGDPATDRYVSIFWVSVSGNWPGAPLPVALFQAGFSTTPGFTGSTLVRFRALDTAAGYGFRGTSLTVRTQADQEGDLDLDGDGQARALTDGLLTLRYLFQFRGQSLIEGVIPDGCTRCGAAELETALDNMQDALDVDGNGRAGALTDGLLILRYLFQFGGQDLIEGVVAEDCVRCTAVDIEAYLQGIMPQ